MDSSSGSDNVWNAGRFSGTLPKKSESSKYWSWFPALAPKLLLAGPLTGALFGGVAALGNNTDIAEAMETKIFYDSSNSQQQSRKASTT